MDFFKGRLAGVRWPIFRGDEDPAEPGGHVALDRAGEQGWRYSDNDWVSKHRQRHATGEWPPL
jgi:hypothetical protein